MKLECQEPPVFDWWHEDAHLQVVLDHLRIPRAIQNHLSMTSGILMFKICILIIAFSFIFNFIWEFIHGNFLYNLNLGFADYFKLILYATSMDSLIILLVYLVIALIFHNNLWAINPKIQNLILFSAIAIIISIYIEYLNVYLLYRWSYSSLMPTIFGIGLSPLVQLAVTGLLSLFILKRILL